MFVRVNASLATLASLVLAAALTMFWVPVSWRSTESGIDGLATRLHDGGIPVMTTLVVYDALTGPTRSALVQDPAVEFLSADTRDLWRSLPEASGAPPRYPHFMRNVVAALHRHGVVLIAGTDAMGLPLVAPGSSLHRELQLLHESGLARYEAIGAATVNPAIFLGKDREFGTIAAGMRADLLLVERNPLQDLRALNAPTGVMTRGRWLTRADLQRMLKALVAKAT